MDGPILEEVMIETLSQCETEMLSESLRVMLNSELEGNLIPLVSSASQETPIP